MIFRMIVRAAALASAASGLLTPITVRPDGVRTRDLPDRGAAAMAPALTR